MPMYAWTGLDKTGRVIRGMLFARSLHDLEKHLFKKNIGLVQACSPLFARTISAQEKHTFFLHMSSLLSARIPLHKALSISASTAKGQMCMRLTDCAALIEEGIPFSEVLTMHGLADDLSYTMITVAEKTGNLSEVLRELADHMTLITAFKNKVRSLLIGPWITFCVFLAVMMSIFIGVIPRFEVYFVSYEAPLPLMTRIILMISKFMRSFSLIYIVLTVSLLLWIAYVVLRKTQLTHKLMVQLPIIGPFNISVQKAHFFTALNLLLKNRVALGQALRTTAHASKNTIIKNEIEAISTSVEAGNPLSEGVNKSSFSCDEIHAFLLIGESSGVLEDMVQHCATVCQEKVYRTISRWTMVAQPVLLIILGSLVACLIFAIYMPLLTLSFIIE